MSSELRIRAPESLVDVVKKDAAEQGLTLSEHVRQLIGGHPMTLRFSTEEYTLILRSTPLNRLPSRWVKEVILRHCNELAQRVGDR